MTPNINHTLQQTREEAYTRAKERGDKAGARALLIALRKERLEREGVDRLCQTPPRRR